MQAFLTSSGGQARPLPVHICLANTPLFHQSEKRRGKDSDMPPMNSSLDSRPRPPACDLLIFNREAGPMGAH